MAQKGSAAAKTPYAARSAGPPKREHQGRKRMDNVLVETQAPTNNVRILFVEDDQLFRETVAKNLQDSGFAVADFESGEAALDYLQSGGEAQLALLDWKLPTLS